jgi:hypothetical protein
LTITLPPYAPPSYAIPVSSAVAAAHVH